MKIRTDFVTNSSSSSFILARKRKLTEKQKKAILDYVEEKMFGEKVLTPESTEEEIQKAIEDDWSLEDNEGAIRKALKEGKDIYSGSINFECCENDLANIFSDIWEAVEKVGEDNFETIDGSLDY